MHYLHIPVHNVCYLVTNKRPCHTKKKTPTSGGRECVPIGNETAEYDVDWLTAMASNSDRVKTIWKEKKKFCQLCCYQRRMAKTSPHILYNEHTVGKLTMVTYLPWSSKTLNQFFFVILHLENRKKNFFDNLRNCNSQNWAFISAPVSQDSFRYACHSLWHVSSASFFCRYGMWSVHKLRWKLCTCMNFIMQYV